MITNQTNAAVGVIFSLTTTQGLIYYFQNFYREGTFLFNGNEYVFAPITYSPPEKNTTRGAGNAEISLPILPEILEILISNSYFKDSVIEAYIITEDFPSAPALQQSLIVVNSYSIEDGGKEGKIKLSCGKRTNAITGVFPNVFFTTGFGSNYQLIGYIPEIPLSGSASVV